MRRSSGPGQATNLSGTSSEMVLLSYYEHPKSVARCALGTKFKSLAKAFAHGYTEAVCSWHQHGVFYQTRSYTGSFRESRCSRVV